MVHPRDDLLPLPGVQPASGDLLPTEIDLLVQHAGLEHHRSPRRAGRKRGVEALAAELHEALRRPHLRQLALIEEAMGIQALALQSSLDIECRNVEQLAEACTAAFEQHPDYEIITSFPGLGDTTGARVLAELGDDGDRCSDARAVKAYAGSARVTRASGRSSSITHRRVKNDRLAAAGWMWAFAANAHSPAAKQHYRRRREVHGDRHAAALRHLFNRLLGCLFHSRSRCWSGGRVGGAAPCVRLGAAGAAVAGGFGVRNLAAHPGAHMGGCGRIWPIQLI